MKQLLIALIAVVIVASLAIAVHQQSNKQMRMAESVMPSASPMPSVSDIVAASPMVSSMNQPTLADNLKAVLDSQNISNAAALNCKKVSDDQFKTLGDSVMAMLAGNETQHSMMENSMGGENASKTVAAHISLGKTYLGCNASMAMGNKMATPDMSMLLMMRTDQKLGNYLTDPSGRTLYIFANDKAGVSTCSGTCAQTWPPYLLPKGVMSDAMLPNFTTIKRADGATQLAWKGMPLYSYATDKMPGDMLGNGFKGLWMAAMPYLSTHLTM